MEDAIRVRHVIEVTTTIDTAPGPDRSSRLDPELETVVYRVVQEALTNAARHANPDAVAVRLSQRDGEVRVSVTDDGGGFDPSRPTDGFGLVGMRERLALVGGQFELSSAPGGTTVAISLPATGALLTASPEIRREPRQAELS